MRFSPENLVRNTILAFLAVQLRAAVNVHRTDVNRLNQGVPMELRKTSIAKNTENSENIFLLSGVPQSSAAHGSWGVARRNRR